LLRGQNRKIVRQIQQQESLMKIFAPLAAVMFAALPALAADLPDLQGREIVVVTENAYPPLQFLDASGAAVGWEYDAMAEIAKRLNATISYENISWDAMIPAVSEGQFDLGMTGITIRDDRKEMVDFSDSYMTSEMVMLVRGDEARFTDAASFGANPDLLMAAQPGTTPFYVGVYNVLDGNEANPRIKLFETFGATVEALRAGDVDLVLTDGTAGAGYVDASQGGLKIIGEKLGTEDFGFIFPKGSDLVAPMNAAIAALKADGTIDALNKKWFLDYKMGE
jgi:polar amino acid transport system substrate-binding protein